MENIIIHLFVPVICVSYDLMVPPDCPVAELTKIIAGGIYDLNATTYRVTGREVLMVKEPAQLLMPDKTLQDYQICDGAELVLL